MNADPLVSDQKAIERKNRLLKRKAYQEAYEKSKAQRHVLCLNGDSTKPIYVDDDVSVGSKIK